jgi:hypothetical protein
MTLSRDEIFARAGLPIPDKSKTFFNDSKEHRLLYNIDNIKEHTNNIQEQNCLKAMSLGQVDTETASQEIESIGRCEPLDSESGFESSAFGPHNIKRCLFQIFKNPTGHYKLKARLNMTDGENVEFIAPLQKTPKKSNFVKHAPDPQQASDFWKAIRGFVKDRYSILPLLGKFHEKTGGRKSVKVSFNVEPDSYAACWFDSDLKSYRFSIMLYDFIVEDEIIDDAYITELQKKSGVVGQMLWINPAYDTRQRPMTAAERRRKGIKPNYK